MKFAACKYPILTLRSGVLPGVSIVLKKDFSTTHPLLNKEIQALKTGWIFEKLIRNADSEWLFYRVKVIRFFCQQFYFR